MYFLNYDELERLSDEVSKMELRYILDYERINSNEDEELLRQVGVALGFKYIFIYTHIRKSGIVGYVT